MILQQNITKMNKIKVECDGDILSEKDHIGMKTDDVYMPSAWSIEKAEPEVVLFSNIYACVCACMHVNLLLQYKLII
jgi:hypothetical protein